jgi:hypothetical protein
MSARTWTASIAATLVAALVCALVAAGGLASTLPGPSIEGVWSFDGGKVAIHPGAEGTLVGTVVSPTKFDECTHEDGEEMWRDMREQPDGSYWGEHQWFYEHDGCAKNPTLGPAAWRVMTAASGGHYLLVCLSSPEAPSQPTIAPDGHAANDTYGCIGSEVESSHVASLPNGEATSTGVHRSGQESFRDAVTLPDDKRCLSRRDFQIHLKDPRYDPLERVVVTLGKRRITVTRHGNVLAATIDLKGLPPGAFTVKISVTTVLGHHLHGSRTYHTCAAKRKTSRPKSLRSLG